MKMLITSLAILGLFGCGGESFTGFTGDNPVSTDADSTTSTDGGLDAISTNTAGGRSGLLEKDGGSVGSGGAPVAAGGSTTVGSGGATGTGGSTTAGSGGAFATGGATSSGGVIGSGGSVACTLVTHTNGVGQTWQDCVPLGTWNESQAMKACVASMGDVRKCSVVAGGCSAVQGISTDVTGTRNYIWGYSGASAGYGTTSGSCPNAAVVGHFSWN